MQVPLELHFHGMEKSAAVEGLVRERSEWLHKRFDRMTHCTVNIEADGKHAHKGKVVRVQIDIGIPGRNPLIVHGEAMIADPANDINAAVRETFATARRRLDEMAEKLASRVRAERSRRRPSSGGDSSSA